ncbi:MAG: type VI secretion system protein TssA [Phycisphaerae bacterium]
MSSEKYAHLVALGKDPIRPDSPAGEVVRYDDVFTQLQAQIDRLQNLTGQEPDWGVVVSLASEILKSKSKDLLVLSYLGVGVFETDGYAGFEAVLEALREYLGAFWESGFPKIKPPMGRVNAVQFLADRILPSVELKGGSCKRQPRPAEKEAVHQCAALLDELNQKLDPLFAPLGASPNIAPLVRAFRELKAKVGPLGQETPPAAPSAAAEGGVATPSAGPALGAGPESFATATQAVQTIVKVAKYLWSQDQKDARAYKLLRAAHFGALAEAPKDKLLPGPPAPRREFLNKTAASGNWPSLLNEAEGQFASMPLWLDLQRFVALALQGFGPAYAAAYQAVAFEAVALNARLPELFELSFKDNSPFADGATRAWLDEIRGQFGGGGTGGGASGASGDALGAAIAEARKLLGQSKGAEAVARLMERMDGTAGRRERFRAQLVLAEFCMDMNKLALATSLLEGLESSIDQYRLEEWEPQLAAKVMANLHESLRKSKPKPTADDVRRGGEVYARLARLDPATALEIEPMKVV